MVLQKEFNITIKNLSLTYQFKMSRIATVICQSFFTLENNAHILHNVRTIHRKIRLQHWRLPSISQDAAPINRCNPQRSHVSSPPLVTREPHVTSFTSCRRGGSRWGKATPVLRRSRGKNKKTWGGEKRCERRRLPGKEGEFPAPARVGHALATNPWRGVHTCLCGSLYPPKIPRDPS